MSGTGGVGLLIGMAVLVERWNGVGVVAQSGIEIMGGVVTIRVKTTDGVMLNEIMAAMDVVATT